MSGVRAAVRRALFAFGRARSDRPGAMGQPNEAALIAYALFSVVGLLPLVLGGRALSLLAGLLLFGVVGHQQYVGIDAANFWPHALPGFVMWQLGITHFRGEGGPLVTEGWAPPLIGVLAFGAIIVITGACTTLGLYAVADLALRTRQHRRSVCQASTLGTALSRRRCTCCSTSSPRSCASAR